MSHYQGIITHKQQIDNGKLNKSSLISR